MLGRGSGGGEGADGDELAATGKPSGTLVGEDRGCVLPGGDRSVVAVVIDEEVVGPMGIDTEDSLESDSVPGGEVEDPDPEDDPASVPV